MMTVVLFSDCTAPFVAALPKEVDGARKGSRFQI
jgi:hypothetical protein